MKVKSILMFVLLAPLAMAADFPALLDGGQLVLSTDGGAVVGSQIPCGEQFALRCAGTAATPPRYRMCLADVGADGGGCAATSADMELTVGSTFDIALEPRAPNLCGVSIWATTNSSCAVYRVRPRSLPTQQSTVR